MKIMLLNLVAICAAMLMITIARAGASPDLKAAIRTTLVMVLAWTMAFSGYGWRPWSRLTWQTQCMFLLSALALVLAWLLYVRARHKQPTSPVATMDKLNVGFSIAFAALFLSDKGMTQSALIASGMIGAALLFAFGRR